MEGFSGHTLPHTHFSSLGLWQGSKEIFPIGTEKTVTGREPPHCAHGIFLSFRAAKETQG